MRTACRWYSDVAGRGNTGGHVHARPCWERALCRIALRARVGGGQCRSRCGGTWAKSARNRYMSARPRRVGGDARQILAEFGPELTAVVATPMQNSPLLAKLCHRHKEQSLSRVRLRTSAAGTEQKRREQNRTDCSRWLLKGKCASPIDIGPSSARCFVVLLGMDVAIS